MMQTGVAELHIDVKETKRVAYPAVIEDIDDIGVASVFVELFDGSHFRFDVLSGE
jgi:hypothetical protein